MSTPYEIISNKFKDNLSVEEFGRIDPIMQEQYLRNAISYYIATIATITPNNILQEITEDLNEVELMLLALLMYDTYLDQEIRKYNRIINISNEFVRMTGAIDRVKTLKDMKLLNQQKINNILSSRY